MHRYALIMCLCLLQLSAAAQLWPADGAVLNYRLIGFRYKAMPGATAYRVEVASGSYHDEKEFAKHIVASQENSQPRQLIQVPAFGASYTWRVLPLKGKKAIAGSAAFHQFATGQLPEVIDSAYRLRIIQPASRYQQAYVFLDGNRVLYDMAGKPIWYLPTHVLDSTLEGQPQSGDLKMTPQGTITCMLANQLYEFDYNGHMLWKGPNDGKVSGFNTEFYHHDFSRLRNGHYMAMSGEEVLWDYPAIEPQPGQPQQQQAQSTEAGKRKTIFGTVIEYDEQGKVVWAWKSAEYLAAADLVHYRQARGSQIIEVHANAFYFDEQKKYLYVSFKNLARIVKVAYPSGKVVATYGQIFSPERTNIDNPVFCAQHSCGLTAKGLIYLFNNNGCRIGKAQPTVQLLANKETPGDATEVVWEYVCSLDGLNGDPLAYAKMVKPMNNAPGMRPGGPQRPRLFPTTGGNVCELSDGAFFVSMNSEYGKLFIVDMDKKEYWSAVPERWNAEEKKWDIAMQYRTSIIETPEALEKLIWNAR